ncbi:nucleoporin Nup120/160-domain-containing protein [Podospora aff. communis PSN243]|uniref:Nucleoporin Nup120/160-domain-containing protein n=1 Tax=Podospora aff. communis PSN243 TaxID=3040156 RepID=A0AAV9GN21_9PEZI|nr:nucleoporin Nup120/160-domain-containing protein [Podospora aff. communis PSN243]
MSTRDFEMLYKEARLNLEPPSASTVVQIRVAPQSSSYRSIGARSSSNPADDEKAYRAKNLATASSIYYRKHHNSPRGILWRVLENDTVLSLRAADVCRQEKDADAPLILNLRFPSPIRTPCIGFADPEGHDALCVYVVDTANQLYSIFLRPDHFKKRTTNDGGALGDAVRVWSPPGFGFKHPHRLVVVNPDMLIVTMHDGGILRFDRNRSHDATETTFWKETIYNVAGWGQSLRGLVSFSRGSTIRHDKVNMETTAATSTAVTSLDTDYWFLFTVCLDHRLRIWDVKSGQILYTGDILNLRRDPQEDTRWTIEPFQNNLIRIVDGAPGQCLVVTYSPIGAGEFKIWKVKANDQGSILVSDCFPNAPLIPASPSSLDVWTLADFGLASHWDEPELWTMWKNNNSYRVQKLLMRPQSNNPFGEGWKGVSVDNAVPPVQASGPCDPIDSTEKWLDLIFFPGRFSKATLETALAMYEKGLGTYKETSSKAGKNIAEAMCSVLGSTTTLDRSSSGGMDYEQFRGTSETQWMRFWRLLLELDKQRGEALSLVLDQEDGMIWVVCSDCTAAIRQCSDLDRIYHNIHLPDKKHEDVAALVSAGLTFVDSFSDSITQLSKAALWAELYEDSAHSDEVRMQQFYDKAAFWRQITDEDAAQVVETLGQSFRIVTPRLYEDLFELITSASEANSQELREPFTMLGKKVVVRAVQETIELHWQILFSQLLLLIHMEYEVENEEEALHSRFDVGSVYRQLVDALRRLDYLRWMTKTELNIPVSKATRSAFGGSGTSSPTTKRGNEETVSVTVLEGVAGHLFGLPENNMSLLTSITDLVLDLCSPESSTMVPTELVQCWLLKRDRPDLALEANPFAHQDPFSTYIQGRVFLALKDHDTAAGYFRKASIGLSISTKNPDRHSAGLLDDTEWNLLNAGLAHYYAHIVSLYDRQKAYSYVVEFSRLALQFAPIASPDTIPFVKNEMLSRLFAASTATSHFDVAHTALLSMEDESMQRSYLRRLVEKMCEGGQNAELIALPFSGLQTKVDDILLEKCKAVKDIVSGVPYHQILYAWRISHNDYRGGAAILLDRLQKLRQAGEGDSVGNDDALDTQVTRQYLFLINALSCVPAKEAYILEDVPISEAEKPKQDAGSDDLEAHIGDLAERLDAEMKVHQSGKLAEDEQTLVGRMAQFSSRQHYGSQPRRFLTLADVRKQYQQELDRIVAIQNNQFGFTAEDDFMELVA